MKKLLLIILAAALSIAASCCDPRHDTYVQSQGNIKICTDRGGVPILEAIKDDGGHSFAALARCDFSPRAIDLEKR